MCLFQTKDMRRDPTTEMHELTKFGSPFSFSKLNVDLKHHLQVPFPILKVCGFGYSNN